MDSHEYSEALKRGEKAYREALSKGEYPYLQVLDEILSHVSIAATVSLGLTEIPSEAIRGTVTAGRRTAFAPNFMPLLGSNTEFAVKWANLCNAHLTEGIHDPVKAYEYMNRYYILEGNKRVSVLKYFGAPTIPATVTRMVPKKTDTAENRVYFEYLDFYKLCPANYLTFTKPGSYARFLELAGKDAETVWTEEERKNLHASFARFQQALKSVFGDKLSPDHTADAYLTYVSVYGYGESLTKVPEEMRQEIAKIRGELQLVNKDDQITVLTEPEETHKNVFGRLLGTLGERKLKVAFLYSKMPATSDWTYGHELGRLHIKEVFGDDIETLTYQNVEPGTLLDETIEKAVAEGADVIFATTRIFLEGCLRASIRHPNVKILCCTLNAAFRRIRSYYARIYEAKFLSGVIAGALSTNGQVGYVADYPIPMNLANVNAFALGVSSVNPSAKVHLIWTTEVGADPEAYFWDHGVPIISGKELVAPGTKTRSFGLYRYDGSGNAERLAMPIYNWGAVYKKIIETIRDGNWDDADRKSGERAVNYWWGMESDAVDLVISNHVPDETRKFVTFLENAIRSRSFSPFYGVIETQTGRIGEPDHRYSADELMTMDWLSANVVGRIPKKSELTEAAQELLTAQERDVEVESKDQEGEA